ncbi:efflux RND transporter periplasmic adaptor subunit [Methylobacterium persicinum]|uniref:Cobalt-zinc-cadmium efflux system membrane fusion protein n=1 Tax=Methylobacterium persicinum TaxID=374426 RepID=A0ABU0HLY5_9HYPH|nr:efflux RND transporter periplasmic adaptor subunit [Methylobacterium persicinum]MDQ0443326.1 cobalt-zinc-cadmium efflux system membrane fusion protein [Methylobacterium persicinum]GJE37683.1 Multidrug resistance protein MdtA [Methylobacterium persicinum]
MDARNPHYQDQAGLEPQRPRRRGKVLRILVLLAVLGGVGAFVALRPDEAREWAGRIAEAAQGLFSSSNKDPGIDLEKAGPVERVFRPSKEQRASFEILPVATQVFRPEGAAEGRIALNDDDNVPVVSPYSGRVTKVMARAGDDVKAGDVLFVVEATDMVQAQNDYQAALNTLQKQQALLKLDQTIATRQQELFQAKAVALKDYQSAQNDVIAAQSDLKTAESALDAVKNRLRLLGKTDAEIVAYEKNGTLSPETKIRAPIAGTIVQRKVGIGQYINASGDPQFVIGDLSTVWLIANVRESEIPKIRIGQEVEAKVAGFGNRIFKARVNYMAASLDPATRRLAVRSEVDNPDRVLRPEMFATYTIITGKGEPSPSVPLSAVVYEGGRTHVWVARPDGAVEARDVQLGLINADNAQVVTGLAAGEQIVTRGALFIDRAASGDKAS